MQNAIASFSLEHLSQDQVTNLIVIYKEGELAERSIVTYRDYLLTSINLSDVLTRPPDASKDKRDVRDPSVPYDGVHPCEI